MIVVRVELHSAITGRVSEIGRMHIANDGESSDAKRGSYDVAVLRRGGGGVTRRGRVENYPRLSYNVWRLICRALKSAFPEEGR